MRLLGSSLGLGLMLRGRVKGKDPPTGDWEEVAHEEEGEQTIVGSRKGRCHCMEPALTLLFLPFPLRAHVAWALTGTWCSAPQSQSASSTGTLLSKRMEKLQCMTQHSRSSCLTLKRGSVSCDACELRMRILFFALFLSPFQFSVFKSSWSPEGKKEGVGGRRG